MATDQPRPPRWPGADDRAVVKEMLRDSKSKHWSECYKLVEGLVHKQAANFPQESQKEIIQEVMLRINRSLPYFRHESTFKTWLISIVPHCIADEDRRRKRLEKLIASSGDSHALHEDDEPHDSLALHTSKSTEDEITIIETLHEAWKAFLEHFATRTYPERDKRIVEMVIYEDYSREEAAEVAGCSVEVVGYVLRTAQEYVRQKLGHQRPQKHKRTLK